MRSTLLTIVAAAIVAPCALASTFTNPIKSAHAAKPQDVFVTFANRTPQERDVHIAGMVYTIRGNSSLNVRVAVGSDVHVTSNVNSKVDEQFQQLASVEDRTTIVLK